MCKSDDYYFTRYFYILLHDVSIDFVTGNEVELFKDETIEKNANTLLER